MIALKITTNNKSKTMTVTISFIHLYFTILSFTVTLTLTSENSFDTVIHQLPPKTMEILNIQHSYIFASPELQVKCDNNNNSINPHEVPRNNQVLVYQASEQRENYCQTCYVRIQENKHTKPMTAIKLDQSVSTIINILKFTIGKKEYSVEVPSTIKKFIVDDILINVKEENPISNPISDFDWWFVDENLKNLRTTDFINEVGEYNVKKLGWYQRQPTDSFYTYSKTEIQNNFKLITPYCKNPHFQLDIVNYYNPNQLLINEIESASIQKLSRVPISDVQINQTTKTVKISYAKPLSESIKVSLLNWTDGIWFDASIFQDKFANRHLNIRIIEEIIDNIIIEIGVPGSLLYSLTVHHNNRPKTYKNQLSAEILRDQWVCVYPLRNSTRRTCRFIWSKRFEFPNPRKESFDEIVNDGLNMKVDFPKMEQVQKGEENSNLSPNLKINFWLIVLAICIHL